MQMIALINHKGRGRKTTFKRLIITINYFLQRKEQYISLNKETVKKNICPIKDCGRPIHKESKYCIFHAGEKEKTEKEFIDALKKYIQETKEDKIYNFRDFIFIGDIDFRNNLNINYFKCVDFRNVVFKGGANFKNTIFEEDAVFKGATFKGVTTFESAIFKGGTLFDGATFYEDTNFWMVTFKEHVSFKGTTFKGDANFGVTTFERFVMFMYTTFKRDTKFDSAIFQGRTFFVEATFEGNVSFDLATLPSGKKLNIKAKKKGIISFIYTKLENIFLDLNLDEGVLIDFSNTLLRNTQIKKDQIEKHILQEKKKEFSEAQQVYILLKNNFHSIGKYNEESWAFKKEKDMERKSYFHFKSLHKWLWSCFLNGIFGYGMQPSKVIISAILIITLFAFLFMNPGISNVVGIEEITSNNFFDCLYFSTITFTTLGYGDFRPLEGWGRILAGSEAFIGAFMMALFVYTFARRTGGR